MILVAPEPPLDYHITEQCRIHLNHSIDPESIPQPRYLKPAFLKTTFLAPGSIGEYLRNMHPDS